MLGRVERVESHGATVQSHLAMDALRKTECLCLNCSHLEPPLGCVVATALYDLCVSNNLAIAVTRCQDFRPKEN